MERYVVNDEKEVCVGVYFLILTKTLGEATTANPVFQWFNGIAYSSTVELASTSSVLGEGRLVVKNATNFGYKLELASFAPHTILHHRVLLTLGSQDIVLFILNLTNNHLYI
ncbi:unnamed protein product, partial [Dovyalis caffra]